MAIDRVKVRANAEKLLRLNKIQEAIRELQKLAEDNPRDIQVLNQIGNLYLRVGNTDAAVPMFIKVAELFAKTGFATKAVASLKIVTREQPDNLPAWQMLANLSEQQGFAREALTAWDKVGELVARSGNLDAAIQVQRKLLELEPDNAKARVQLGDSLIRQGKKEEGTKHYLKAAGQLSSQGLVKEAARMYERAIELEPGAVGTLEGVVKGYLSQRHPEVALQLLDGLLERKPKLDPVLLLKVEVLTEMRQLGAAEKLCQKLLAAHPGNLAILSRLIRLLMADKKVSEAMAMLEGEVAKAGSGQMADVAALYEEVARFAPDQVPLLKGLCAIYRRLRNNARLVLVLAELANRASQQGLMRDARDALQELAQLDPANPRYAEDLRSVEAKLGLAAAEQEPAPEPPSPPPVAAPAAEPPEPVEAPEELAVEVEDTGESAIEVGAEDLGSLGPTRLDVTASLHQPQAIAAEPPVAQRAEEPSAVEEVPAAETRALDAREGEIIREQLTEAEVFLKYGLTEKAVGELQSILKKVPDHIHAHQKLIAIYKSQKNSDKLVRQMLRLAEVFKRQGDEDTYENLLDEARSIDPNHKALKALAEGEGEQPKVGAKAAAGSLELDLGLLTPAVAEPRPVPAPAEEEIVLNLEPASSPRRPVPPEILIEEPPAIEVEVEEPVAEPGPGDEVETGAPVEASEGPALLPPIVEESPAESLAIQFNEEELAARNTLAEQLEEAEFYLSQELFGEAQKALQVLLDRWPEDPRVAAFQAKLAGASLPTGEPAAEEARAVEADRAVPPEPAQEIPARSLGLFTAGDDTSSQLEMAGALAVEEASAESPEPVFLEDTASEPVAGGEAPAEAPALEEVESPVAATGEEPPPETPELLEEETGAGTESAPAESVEAVPSRPVSAEFSEAGLRDVLADLAAPPKPRAKLKMNLKELLPEEAERPGAEPPGSDEYYDLASELGAALDGLQAPEESLFEEESKSPEEMSFEEVFEEFKKGVEKKVPEEDFATHYNLGIAYKEMELLDEAIGEFQLAARSPQYFVECCSMLGLCFRQKGMGELAEKWYRKGIAAPGFSEEIYVGLKYDLAETLAEEGHADEARDLFKEVFAANANYRDVKSKVKQPR